MKKYSTLFTLALICFLFSNCKKNNDSPNNALFQVTIDGTVWKADSVFASGNPTDPLYDNFTIAASDKNGNGFFLNKTGLTTASTDFVIASASLASFNVFRDFTKGNFITVTWSTIAENETEKFVIERAYDGLVFEKAGEVMAAGNSTNKIDYVWREKPPVNEAFGRLYYRIKTIDKDGAIAYSELKVITYFTPALYIYDSGNYSYGFNGSISITSNNTEKRLLSGTFYFSCIDDATGRTIKMENGKFENVPY